MTEVEMIDLYEELVENLQTLNKKAPEIMTLYNNAEKEIRSLMTNAKDELSKAEESGLKQIKELSSERKKQIDDRLIALNDGVSKAAKLQDKIELSSDFVKQASEQFDKITECLDRLQERLDEQQLWISSLEERIDDLEVVFEEGIVPDDAVELAHTVEIDFDELAPAIELFEKYNGKIGRPIVLEKENYTSDYCFRVSGIDRQKKVLIGRYYQRGKLYGNNNQFSFSTTCRMYNGNTLESVISGEI